MHLKHACLPISPPEQGYEWKTAYILPFFQPVRKGGELGFLRRLPAARLERGGQPVCRVEHPRH